MLETRVLYKCVSDIYLLAYSSGRMDTSILAPMDEIYLITKIREAMIPDTDMHSVTDKADQTK